MTDYDPRIVALYDGDNPDGPDHDYFRSLATTHGAQRIPDPEWESTLRQLRRVSAEGCLLAFESRNPGARAWENWQPCRCARRAPTTANGGSVMAVRAVATGRRALSRPTRRRLDRTESAPHGGCGLAACGRAVAGLGTC